MADSNITKRALAGALKELMEEMPFAKINISDICGKCNMNRKSFYYHFRDKYDLVNWIFDTEFIAMASQKNFDNGWSFFAELCRFLDADRDFYRRAMQIKGQNSFSDHFREFLLPIIAEYMKPYTSGQEPQPFHVTFFADALLCAIERWLLSKNAMPADEFSKEVRACFRGLALGVYQEMSEEERQDYRASLDRSLNNSNP
ncbi:MAG: TetR/AcrR family transcriptional regulator C-terminal domain-containing protein [Clostridiales bacterium]|nr:TetR/AcrR family transcriptional regulator C-terminal domain-containing protein [Clostridiales bacterium]